jgi:tetratricopeptide (TPR) repeat protein
MNVTKKTIKKTMILLILFLSAGCGGGSEKTADAYYIAGTGAERESLEDLFALLADESAAEGGEGSAGAHQFALVREIANSYMRLGEYGRLINFLGERTDEYPGDPYNGYYRLMTAYAYIQQDALPVAAKFFELIVKNYPDLTVNGESIHLVCLNQLINLTDNPEQRVRYYQELISRFPEKIDMGTACFMLGQAYERIGEWNGAIEAYTRYLPYMGTIIPGFPSADNYAKHIVDFSNSPRDWTFENLNVLLSNIRTALDAGNSARLWQYRAKVNFFARSWGQEETDDAGMAEFNLSEFMRGNRIYYTDSLDAGSNANEAYLKTWGWSQYISTWYFYFRKVNFPADPEIHGRWEWAGVYYGEKF